MCPVVVLVPLGRYLNDELTKISHVVDGEPAEDVRTIVVDNLESFGDVEILQNRCIVVRDRQAVLRLLFRENWGGIGGGPSDRSEAAVRCGRLLGDGEGCPSTTAVP